MKSIGALLEERRVASTWKGSLKSAEYIREQLRERFGDKVADEYDPKIHVMSLRQWSSFGIRVNKGESALQAYTFFEDSESSENGKQKLIKRSVPVFHYLQTNLTKAYE